MLISFRVITRIYF